MPDTTGPAGGSQTSTPPEPDLADKLRDIQSITDAALSRLDPQEMLDALVERVRHALCADTAAVLLLDQAADHLVATAACGLEEEVRQGVRVPVGRGFAGRIAAECRCVILDKVDHTNVVNPILLDKGIWSLMGAPLRSDGAVIGVMHVGTLSPRAFTPQDADLLQIAADRAAMAVQALNAQVDREAAVALQRSLLPSALPVVAGLQMAARLVPGVGSIGGDWYDVFALPSGQICAVIGDVAGSGLKAAVIMGRMRSALRAYALETPDPADMLGRLERKMAHFEPDAMATVLCAVFSSGFDQVAIANAGHVPPILAVPGEAALPAPVAADTLIGAGQRRTRQVSVVDIPPGAVLCLYTDGLVERRHWPIDEGIDHLCKAIQATEPEICCSGAMAAMAEASPHSDDVAMLAFRRVSPPDEHEVAAKPHITSALSDKRVRWSGRHAVITAPAEIDVTTAQDFQSLLTSVADRSPDAVTVDMRGTSFCDSAGLNVLTRVRRQFASGGTALRIALGNSPVRRIFELSGVDQIIEIVEAVD